MFLTFVWDVFKRQATLLLSIYAIEQIKFIVQLSITKPITIPENVQCANVMYFTFPIRIRKVSLYFVVKCFSFQVKNVLVEHAFEVSSFLFFVGPMTLICVLYVLIGIKLRKSKLLQGVKRRSCEFGRGITGQTRVIRMLSTLTRFTANNSNLSYKPNFPRKLDTGYTHTHTQNLWFYFNSCRCCGIFPVLGTIPCTAYYGCLRESYPNHQRSIPWHLHDSYICVRCPLFLVNMHKSAAI